VYELATSPYYFYRLVKIYFSFIVQFEFIFTIYSRKIYFRYKQKHTIVYKTILYSWGLKLPKGYQVAGTRIAFKIARRLKIAFT